MSPDFLDLLRALSGADARFLVVGAYAVGVRGRPRATKDLDVWVEASAVNAPKVINGLVEFGAPLMDLTETDLQTAGIGLQIGVEPGRIDVLTAVGCVSSRRHTEVPCRQGRIVLRQRREAATKDGSSRCCWVTGAFERRRGTRASPLT